MPDWPQFVDWWLQHFPHDAGIVLSVLLFRFAAAFVLGCFIAAVYYFSQGKPPGQSVSMMATLVLLTVLIAMVTMTIGESLARAFSLAGALAIIRFRTVVEDTRDTAFVIFAVAEGMAFGAGFMILPLIGAPFVAIAAFIFRPRAARVAGGAFDYALSVRLGVGHDPEARLGTTLQRHVAQSRLLSVGTARQGAALELNYGVSLHHDESAAAFVAELNTLEGVQNVDLRRI